MRRSCSTGPASSRSSSPENVGLFTWYPIVALALVTALVVRESRKAAVWFSVALAIFVALYGFWHSPSLGGGFGHRGFVELMPAGIVIFALALAHLPPRWRAMSCALALVAAVSTVQLMAGYWRGTVPFGGTTSDVYWSHPVGHESWLR